MDQQPDSHDMKTTCPQCRTPHSEIYSQAIALAEAQWQAQQAEQQAQQQVEQQAQQQVEQQAQTTCLRCSIRGYDDDHHMDQCDYPE